jgi:hypothetical protein
MSVRPLVAISATATRQISVKFDTGAFYKNVKKIKISFKSGKNTGHHLKIGTLYRCKRHYTAIQSVKVSGY